MNDEIYNFSGRQADRSELSLTFDGVLLVITVENQNKSNKFISVIFHKTFNYEFESIASMVRYPTECSELLIAESAEHYLSLRQERISSFFAANLKKYSVYFEDYGLFTVFAESVEIEEHP